MYFSVLGCRLKHPEVASRRGSNVLSGKSKANGSVVKPKLFVKAPALALTFKSFGSGAEADVSLVGTCLHSFSIKMSNFYDFWERIPI
jgi:hypothetical protein